MANYQLVATTTVDATANGVSILSGVDDTAEVEVTSADAAIWLNVAGGNASVAGANCIFVPANGSVLVSGATSYKAIRDASTSARVQVGVVS